MVEKPSARPFDIPEMCRKGDGHLGKLPKRVQHIYVLTPSSYFQGLFVLFHYEKVPNGLRHGNTSQDEAFDF